jgi:hypothetical protein
MNATHCLAMPWFVPQTAEVVPLPSLRPSTPSPHPPPPPISAPHGQLPCRRGRGAKLEGRDHPRAQKQAGPD